MDHQSQPVPNASTIPIHSGPHRSRTEIQLSFDNITGHLRRAQHFNIHLDQWFDTQNDLMCSLIAELNIICAKIVPHIRLQPPASSSAARNSRLGDGASRPFRGSNADTSTSGYTSAQPPGVMPSSVIPNNNTGVGGGVAVVEAPAVQPTGRGPRTLQADRNGPPSFYPQHHPTFEQHPPVPSVNNFTPPPQQQQQLHSGHPQAQPPLVNHFPSGAAGKYSTTTFHPPQAQGITFQNLLDRLSNGLHLGPTDLENALLILTPQGMQKLNPAIFVSIIPTLSIWVRQLQRTFHAFSLLHEGFCHFPAATQRQYFTQVSAVYAAVKDVLSDSSLLAVLSKHGVAKDRVQEFAAYLKHAIDAEVG